MTSLDIDLLRSFATVAATRNFTTAGEALGATQSAISVRLKKLEDRLGQLLLERTPRSVELTPFGERFLIDARRILSVHDEAVRRAVESTRPLRLRLGLSEHAVGHRLTEVISRLTTAMPQLKLGMQLGLSEELMDGLHAGRFDAIVRLKVNGDPAPAALPPGFNAAACRETLLYADELVWTASSDLGWMPGDPVPLVSIAAPCRVGATAMSALDGAGIPWIETFFSRGVATVQAAVAGGLGIGCLSRASLPAGVRTFGPDTGLPRLPGCSVVMETIAPTAAIAPALSLLAETLRQPRAG